MYKLYGSDILSALVVDKEQDPELWKFVEDNKDKPHFSNYTTAKLQDFLSRIYELRKDNSNNTSRQVVQ